MDKEAKDARRKAMDALASAVAFWGVDPLETKLFAALFLSPRPLNHGELAEELGADDEAVNEQIKLLERLGAVKRMEGARAGCPYYEAEADFFQILQTVLKERRELEMGRALEEINSQKEYFETRFDDEGEPELEFMAKRLDKLNGVIKLVDKTMYGLGALASFRNMFKSK
jgi:DNA-binding transcriptional regulator GbsR (MarR family)